MLKNIISRMIKKSVDKTLMLSSGSSRLVFFLILACCNGHIFATESTQWRVLAPGLEYTTLHPVSEIQQGVIHAFRIDLKYYQLHSVLAQHFNETSAYVSGFAEHAKALIAINGGFFSPSLVPLGLRVQAGTTINPLKNTGWWGIFLIRKQRAIILPQQSYSPLKDISFAVQAGPRLLINSHIPPLKPGEEQRSALGITQTGKVILLATENLPLSTSTLANLMARSEHDGGLNCRDALNLDGGSSTQIYAKINNFSLSIPSFRSVADAVVVTTKQAR